MRPLFHCRCCGFLSTLGSEFTRVDGVLVDRLCAERVRAGDDRETRWLADARATPSI